MGETAAVCAWRPRFTCGPSDNWTWTCQVVVKMGLEGVGWWTGDGRGCAGRLLALARDAEQQRPTVPHRHRILGPGEGRDDGPRNKPDKLNVGVLGGNTNASQSRHDGSWPVATAMHSARFAPRAPHILRRAPHHHLGGAPFCWKNGQPRSPAPPPLECKSSRGLSVVDSPATPLPESNHREPLTHAGMLVQDLL